MIRILSHVTQNLLFAVVKHLFDKGYTGKKQGQRIHLEMMERVHAKPCKSQSLKLGYFHGVSKQSYLFLVVLEMSKIYHYM